MQVLSGVYSDTTQLNWT